MQARSECKPSSVARRALQIRGLHPPPHLRAFSSTTTAADTAGSTIASATDTVRLTGLTRIGSEGVFASSLSPEMERGHLLLVVRFGYIPQAVVGCPQMEIRDGE